MRRSRTGGGRAVLLALSLGACGPYAELAQKLDVTARIAGDTWIAAGPDRALETRILLVGRPDANGVAPFSFTSIAADCLTLQGTWTESGSAGDAALRVAHTYTMPAATGPNAAGSQRDDKPWSLRITVARSGNRLVVSGDIRLAGTYVALADALAGLGAATERDAACAYQVASLSIQGSEIRIIGFGSAGMTQYLNSASFIGTIGGTVTVSMSIGTSVRMRVAYDGFEDEGGVRLSGAQTTSTSWGGSGGMSGAVGFSIAPPSLDPAMVATAITGTIDYGTVTLAGGNTSGGAYVTHIDGGPTAAVPAVGSQSPDVAECLNLP